MASSGPSARQIPVRALRTSRISMLVGGGLVLVALGVFTLVASQYAATHLRVQAMERAADEARAQGAQVSAFLEAIRDDVRLLAETSTLPQLRSSWQLGQRLAVLQKLRGGTYVDVSLLDATGDVLAYAGPYTLQQVGYGMQDWFAATLSRGQAVSSVMAGHRGVEHLVVAVRLHRGTRDYVLRATVDALALDRAVDRPAVQDNGVSTTFILNARAEQQTQLPSEALSRFFATQQGWAPPGTGQSDQASATSLQPDGAGPLAGSGTYVPPIFVDESRTPALVFATTSLKDGDWLLVCQTPARQLFATVHSVRWRLILGGLSATLLAMAGLAVLGWRVRTLLSHAAREREHISEQVIEAGKLASLGELAAGIAHEINNPVAVMLEEAGWVEDLLDEDGLASAEHRGEAERSLAQIRRQGGRCREITQKLLSFARRAGSESREIDVNAVVEDMVGLARRKTRGGSVRVAASLAHNLPLLDGSESELQQVVLNLLNNAIDAVNDTSEGGQVRVSTRLLEGGQRVTIAVSDTGHGIARANLSRVFDPFFTTKPVGQGTGLGLSICYGIIKNMGGDISVDSTPGEGTVFSIVLPVPTGEAEAVGQGDEAAANMDMQSFTEELRRDWR